MIEFGSEQEKEVFTDLFRRFGGDKELNNILDAGVASEEQARVVARFYWKLVEEAQGENIDYWLEKIYTTLHIHVGNQGFETIWEEELP